MLVENRLFELTQPLFDAVGISPRYLASENLNPWAIVWRCLREPTLNHFGTVLTCDGQTDGHTHDDRIYRASLASRGKNSMTSVIYL